MKTRKIVYIYLKEEGKRFYYASMATFFNNIEYERVKITDQSVKNYMSTNKTNIFENDKLFIEKDIPLILDKGTPRKPKNILTIEEAERLRGR